MSETFTAGPKEKKEAPDAKKEKKEAPKEKYWRVSFQAKSNPNDPENVTLSVNGETLIIQREKEVTIPNRFKECADNGVYPVYRQLPNEPRKITGYVRHFPYDLRGEGTAEDFYHMKKEGTKETMKSLEKYGMDAPRI